MQNLQAITDMKNSPSCETSGIFWCVTFLDESIDKLSVIDRRDPVLK